MDCYSNTNIPINQEEDPCNGTRQSTLCVIEPTALTLLGLPENSTQSEINLAIINAIQTSQLTTENLESEILKEIKVSLTTEQIQTLASTPIQIITPQGAGTVIEVFSAFFKLNYGAEAFLSTKLSFTGAYQMEVLGLNNTTNTLKYFKKLTGNTSSDIQENTGLFIQADSNSTAQGDSTVDIYLTYKIKQL